MIDIPLNPMCPNCKTEGIDNLNMVITIITEQPLVYYKKLPNKIDLHPKTSRNSSWVSWDYRHNKLVCRNCGYSNIDPENFEKQN